MRTAQGVAPDSALAVSPNISCNQPDDVIEVRAESGLRVFARFCDGTEGVIEMSTLVHSESSQH